MGINDDEHKKSHARSHAHSLALSERICIVQFFKILSLRLRPVSLCAMDLELGLGLGLGTGTLVVRSVQRRALYLVVRRAESEINFGFCSRLICVWINSNLFLIAARGTGTGTGTATGTGAESGTGQRNETQRSC
ncbi:uncharacterized protein Dvir_GJ25622 [Drosophila virilis]|uniref:Uncharacterized protein n=1 Tax=Drosophila virilis TaxID=7244 RepID=A0A0Q9WRN3_DROVI|nr:uncharacterized protein Dvir_GJ25622 [Drosophila virilis]